MNSQFQKFKVKGCEEEENYYAEEEEEESTTTTTTTTTITVTEKNHILTTKRKTVRGNTAMRFPGGTLKPTQPTTAPPPPPGRNDTDDYNITTPNPDTDNGENDDLVTLDYLVPYYHPFSYFLEVLVHWFIFNTDILLDMDPDTDGDGYPGGEKTPLMSKQEEGEEQHQQCQANWKSLKKSTRKQRRRRKSEKNRSYDGGEEASGAAAGPTGGNSSVEEGEPSAAGVEDLIGAVGGEQPRVHTPPTTTSKWGIPSPYWYHHQSGIKNQKRREKNKQSSSFQDIPMDDYPPSEIYSSTDSNIEIDDTPFMTPIKAEDLYEKDTPEAERKNVLYSLYDTLFDFDPMQTIRDLHMPGLRNRVPPPPPPPLPTTKNVENI